MMPGPAQHSQVFLRANFHHEAAVLSEIPHLGDYTGLALDEYRSEAGRPPMQAWVLQDSEFHAKVRATSRSRYNFYSYSLWRSRNDEHLFDGVAGDLAEALDTLRAHFRHLSGKGEPAVQE
jgi:hypothetical protein